MVMGQGRKKRHMLLDCTNFQFRFSLIGIAVLTVATMNLVALHQLSKNVDTEGVHKLMLQDSVRNSQNSPRGSNDQVRFVDSKSETSGVNKRLANSSEQSPRRGQKVESKHKIDDNERPASPESSFELDLEYRITFPWKHARGANLSPRDRLDVDKSVTDYDGIEFESIRTAKNFARQISPHDGGIYEKLREQELRDKVHDVLPQYDNDPPVDENDPCRRNAWMDTIYPTCNTLHEIAYDRAAGTSGHNFHMKAVGSGTFRQTFIFDQVYQSSDTSYVRTGESFAVKDLLFRSHFDRFILQQLHIIHYEALILERLSASPRIATIYTHCGSTNLLESLPNEVNEMIQPGDGRADHTKLIALDDVYPKNDLTGEEKAGIALDMAEAIADLSGFRDGVIVNGDNHIDQFLADADGVVKLGDFNLAHFLRWNDKLGEYCKIEREAWRYPFRAPEEIMGTPFDEKIDVFTMGNNIYSILTGLRPFYDTERAKEICMKIENGQRGFIDIRYRNHSYVESKLVEILDLCWEQNGDRRVDIFTIADMLRDLVNRTSTDAPARR